MYQWFKRAVLGLIILVVFAGLILRSVHFVKAEGGSNWFGLEAPQLGKSIELTSTTQDMSGGVDCSFGMYSVPGQLLAQPACMFNSPVGSLSTSGMIQIGADRLANLEGPSPASFFLPTVNASIAVVSLRASGTGNYLGVYRHLTEATLRHNFGGYYDITTPPDEILKNPTTGEPLEVNTESIAYSQNGEWMVVEVPQVGLLRVNMSDLAVHLFAGSIEPSWYLGLASVPLAISDDGRYVAANTDIFSSGKLMVYDLSTCSSQLNVAADEHVYCASKDILNGDPGRKGLLAVDSTLRQPSHLRFVSNDSVGFNARYGSELKGATKLARFVATANDGKQHGLGLLGMGDSYISGQGAFAYKESTDTKNNSCHLSLLAYPFALGKSNFDAYNSIACSGARTFDIVGNNPNNVGQVNDGIQEKNRDKADILSNFLPGYIYQQEFAAAYRPEAILLSVGGDDIGFADIVKSCVANVGGGTCYGTYEDRAEIINEIDATYAKLVATYSTVREQSAGARLYVVGYPQVAKPGGDCGLNVHLNEQEVEFAAQLIDYLDSIVKQAAQTAGVFYVDTQRAFDGHRLCESGEKAMNGLTAGGDAGFSAFGKAINVIGAESYHPTAFGYRLLATAIANATNNLMAPMPSIGEFRVPEFNPTTSLLQGVPLTGRPINWVTNDDTIASNFMLRGELQQITLNGNEVQLQPGSKYQIVLHSNPVLLDEGGVDADGNIMATVRIPADMPPGFHVLHVYGTNLAGGPVDVRRTVYVAASADDYDGDGILNAPNSCLVVDPSGIDADGDGLDDACDSEVTTLSTPSVSVKGAVGVERTTSEGMAADQPTRAPPLPSTKPMAETSAVLGAASLHKNTSSTGLNTAVTGHTAAAQLFRLNWSVTLAIGFGLTVLMTIVVHMTRRTGQ